MPTLQMASKKYVDDNYLPRSGGDLSGNINIRKEWGNIGFYNSSDYRGLIEFGSAGQMSLYSINDTEQKRAMLTLTPLYAKGLNAMACVGVLDGEAYSEYNLFGQHNESSSPFLYLGGNRRTLYLDEANIDDIAETSLYNISCVGTHKLPFPFENSAWAFVLTLVHSHVNSYRTQIIFDMNHRSWDYGGSCIAIRTMQNGTWQAWSINGNIHQTTDLVASQSTLTNGLCCLVYE